MNRQMELDRIVRRLEALLGEAPSPAPRRRPRPRVRYVAVPKARRAMAKMRPRVADVLGVLVKHPASALELRREMRVNRNVIAGALHDLRQAHLIKAEPISA